MLRTARARLALRSGSGVMKHRAFFAAITTILRGKHLHFTHETQPKLVYQSGSGVVCAGPALSVYSTVRACRSMAVGSGCARTRPRFHSRLAAAYRVRHGD